MTIPLLSPLELQQRTTETLFPPQQIIPHKTRGYIKQSGGEFTHPPPQAAFLCEAHGHTIYQTVAPRPVHSQPVPIGLIYKPNRESMGT